MTQQGPPSPDGVTAHLAARVLRKPLGFRVQIVGEEMLPAAGTRRPPQTRSIVFPLRAGSRWFRNRGTLWVPKKGDQGTAPSSGENVNRV